MSTNVFGKASVSLTVVSGLVTGGHYFCDMCYNLAVIWKESEEQIRTARQQDERYNVLGETLREKVHNGYLYWILTRLWSVYSHPIHFTSHTKNIVSAHPKKLL